MARNFCLLIILPLFSFCDEFIFWAWYSAQNQILKSKNINISQAMVLSHSLGDQICTLPHKKDDNQTTLEFLKEHSNLLEDCFISSKVKVLDASKFSTNKSNLQTQITYIPIRFAVNFEGNNTIITQIKGQK